MKKEDKVNLVIAGAGVLIALYAFTPKGDKGIQESSGGFGTSEGGLPGGSGSGGADTPTVNIDFPPLPQIFNPDPAPPPTPTKKEASLEDIWNRAIDRGYTYNPVSGQLEKQLSENVKGTYGKTSFGFGGSWDEPTKKEAEITSKWDLRLFGKTRSEQMAMAPGLFKTNIGSLAERTTRGSVYSVNASPTPVVTKKEISVSRPTGNSSSGFYGERTGIISQRSQGFGLSEMRGMSGRFGITPS